MLPHPAVAPGSTEQPVPFGLVTRARCHTACLRRCLRCFAGSRAAAMSPNASAGFALPKRVGSPCQAQPPRPSRHRGCRRWTGARPTPRGTAATHPSAPARTARPSRPGGRTWLRSGRRCAACARLAQPTRAAARICFRHRCNPDMVPGRNGFTSSSLDPKSARRRLVQA